MLIYQHASHSRSHTISGNPMVTKGISSAGLESLIFTELEKIIFFSMANSMRCQNFTRLKINFRFFQVDIINKDCADFIIKLRFFCSSGIFKIKFLFCALEEGEFSIFYFVVLQKLLWKLDFAMYFCCFCFFYSDLFHSFYISLEISLQTLLPGRSSNIPFFLLSKFSWP